MMKHSEINNTRDKITPSGFKEIDECFDGFRLSELVVIASVQHMNASKLPLQLAQNISKTTSVLYVAFGDITVAEKHLLDKENISIYEGGNNSIAALKAYFQEKVQKEKVIIIDDVIALRSRESVVKRLRAIGKELKGIAMDNEVSVLAFLSIIGTRDRLGFQCYPDFADIQRSENIDRYADKAIVLFQPELYNYYMDSYGYGLDGVVEGYLFKNNSGRTGDFRLRIEKDSGTFEDWVFDEERDHVDSFKY